MGSIVNEEQAAAWDGVEGDEWTETDEHKNAMLRAHSELLFAAAGVAPADHVLDVGCGCGATTREAARRAPQGDALGVDLSARMLERARELSLEEGVPNARFEQADAQVHAFPPEGFDLILSRMGVMFFGDPVAAFTNIATGTRPGGRLAAIVWQEFARNEWVNALRAALAMGRTLPTPPNNAPGPFGFSDPPFVRDTLGTAGFTDVELGDVQAPFWLGADAEQAFANVKGLGVVRGLLDDLDPDQRAQALDTLRVAIADRDTPDGVAFDSRCWLVTARRS